MRAARYARFGPPDVLVVDDVPTPEPGDSDVLIRVHASTVTQADSLMRQGKPLWGRVIIGFARPRRRFRGLGLELAGVVEAVGTDVKRFTPGDEVFGFAGFNVGANAEYFCMPESGSLCLKPANKGFEESAASVDGFTTAKFFLVDKANVQAGQRVLVIGASGSIGTYAVQLARYLGAEVTGVCSGANAELVTDLGAHQVIDYTRDDFTKSGQTWDVIFDSVGRSSFGRCRGSLSPHGTYVSTTGLANYFLAGFTRFGRGKRVRAGMSVEKNASLVMLKELLEADHVRVVIDRTYPLSEIAQAHAYVDSGRKRGNVVVRIPE